jgi:hypothetical protein
MATTSIENIKSMEVECAKLYAESTRVWTQPTKDVELQNTGHKIHAAQDKAQMFIELMITLPLAEGVTTMAENMKLYSEINHLRAKQQARVKNIEVLQEEVYKVIVELATTQGKVKQVATETAKKLKMHLTA